MEFCFNSSLKNKAIQ